MQELVSLPQAVPSVANEGHVSTLGNIIVGSDEVEWRRVCRRVRVREVGEPIHKVGALGNLVGDLSICALILGDELQCGARRGEVAFGIESQRSPERITPKEPGKSRTLAGPRSSISGNQSCA